MSRGTRERMWAGESGLAPAALAVATAPLAVLYGTAVRIRNLAYDRGLLRSRRGPVPVVSIGNLAVGGTGKTPVSAWLAGALVERGRRPALVLRGYGEDEILLHRRWNPSVPVIRAPKRLAGIREAADRGCDVAVLDDGFQHRALQRDVDIVLLSPAHPLPPRLLPRGPWREPLRALRRADHVLVTAKGASEAGAAHAMARRLSRIARMPPVDVLPLGHGAWASLEGDPADAPSGVPLVVSSVAQPDAFVRSVARRTDSTPPVRVFPDHHDYTRADVEALARLADRQDPGTWIATTEKDAVKLLEFRELLPEVRVLPLVVSPEKPELVDSLLGAEAGTRPGSDAGRP